MNFKDVKIPRQMRALMRDKRGYPVPYTVLRDSDGVPHFAVNDSARVSRCIKENGARYAEPGLSGNYG